MAALGTVARRKTRCPRCDLPLAPVKSAGALLAGCGKCRGVWVDRKVFDIIPKADSGRARFGAAREARGNRMSSKQTVKCPVCYYWMDAKNFENCPGLVVDVCRRHGTWLDTDELQTVLRFVKERRGGVVAGDERTGPVAAVNGGATLAGAVAVAGVAAGSGPAPAVVRPDRSTLDKTLDVAMDALDFIDIGDLGDIGDLVGGVGEIGASLFCGLG